MPKLKYWWRISALFPAMTTALGIMLGLLGIKTMIPAEYATAIYFAFALLSLCSWWQAAKQAQEADEQKSKNKELIDILNQMKEHMPKVPTESLPSGVENLSHLTNARIREMVKDLSSRMRAFEGGLHQARARVSDFSLNSNASKEDRNAAFQKKTAEILEQSAAAGNEFRSRLLPVALTLRDEMRTRLGIFPPIPQESLALALEYGMLSGVHPLSDAADYLEAIARKLT